MAQINDTLAAVYVANLKAEAKHMQDVLNEMEAVLTAYNVEGKAVMFDNEITDAGILYASMHGVLKATLEGSVFSINMYARDLEERIAELED